MSYLWSKTPEISPTKAVNKNLIKSLIELETSNDSLSILPSRKSIIFIIRTNVLRLESFIYLFFDH